MFLGSELSSPFYYSLLALHFRTSPPGKWYPTHALSRNPRTKSKKASTNYRRPPARNCRSPTDLSCLATSRLTVSSAHFISSPLMFYRERTAATRSSGYPRKSRPGTLIATHPNPVTSCWSPTADMNWIWWKVSRSSSIRRKAGLSVARSPARINLQAAPRPRNLCGTSVTWTRRTPSGPRIRSTEQAAYRPNSLFQSVGNYQPLGNCPRRENHSRPNLLESSNERSLRLPADACPLHRTRLTERPVPG
jgi:hypothetical protein